MLSLRESRKSDAFTTINNAFTPRKSEAFTTINITPAIGDRSRGGLLIYDGCSHTPEGRRNVGHEYVTEIKIFPSFFFSTGKGGNGHTHSTPQHTAPNYPPIGLTSVSHRRSRIGLASVSHRSRIGLASVSHHRSRIIVNYPKLHQI